MNRRKHFPVPPYRVQKLLGRSPQGNVWETVKRARPAVAERVYLRMQTDWQTSGTVRLIQR